MSLVVNEVLYSQGCVVHDIAEGAMVSDSYIESSYNPGDVVVIVSDCTVSDCTVVVLFSGSVGDVSDIAEEFVSDSGSDVSDSAVIVVVSDLGCYCI